MHRVGHGAGRRANTRRSHRAQGPIPLDEALPIAKQIAEALEAAHEQGIIHRDLKPANIKVRPDGTVKVLDFGLAKAMDPVGRAPNVSQSPTITTPAMMTGVGVILGTAAYMSPEQAKGRAADKRSDVWSFGCVLYEMLTGRCAFEGETVNEILADVLKTEPDWDRLPSDMPSSITRMLRRCLRKDPRDRLRHIGDAKLDLQETAIEPRSPAMIAFGHPRHRERVAWASALVALMVGATGTMVWVQRPVERQAELRVEITTPPTADPSSLAISPDGRQIVFSAMSDGRSRLWLRRLDTGTARPLPGTTDGRLPFWSPDNRSIGFFADGRLKRIDVDGGSVRVLSPALQGAGGSWGRDGTIVYTPTNASAVYRVAADGGEATPAAGRGPSIEGRFPQFLPDSRHFLYTAAPSDGGIFVGQLDTSEAHRLLEADAAWYSTAGYLLFVRQGTLLAQRFDLARLSLTGNPWPLVEHLGNNTRFTHPAVSVSDAGVIIYRANGSDGLRQFVWVDRAGTGSEAWPPNGKRAESIVGS